MSDGGYVFIDDFSLNVLWNMLSQIFRTDAFESTLNIVAVLG